MTDEFATSNVLTPVARKEQAVWRLLRNPMGIVSAAILAVVLLVALVGPLLAPIDPHFSDVTNIRGPIDGTHILGTDSVGRDVWSRLLTATQLTIISALLCVGVAILIGVPSGLIAGYYGGFFDRGAGWMTELLMSLPGIIVLLAVRAALGPSVWVAMAMLGVLISPTYFRLTRTAVQNVRNELYVDAARVSGLSDARIIARHILSVVRAPLIIQTAMIFGLAIAVQSGLEFLGLGDSRTVTWGALLGDGFENIYQNPLLILWPALAIGLTVGALVLFANALRDALEDRPQARRSRQGRLRTESPVRGRSDEEGSPRAATASQVTDPGDQQQGAPLLVVKELAVAFDQPGGMQKRVVDDVSFTVNRGEVLGLVGESGSGKTQTAFAILGLLAREAHIVAGTILVDGVETVGSGRTVSRHIASLRGRRISYIPQEPMSNLDPNFTVGAQLTRPMVKVLRISKSEARRRALELLARVGIPDPAETYGAYPHEISGGMAQRVLIAGAVSCEPDLVIADEPTTALDVTVQAEVLDILREMKDDLGVGILLVTHNFGVVADLADRVVVMRHGRVMEQGVTRDILRNPQHPYTRVLIGSMIQGREPMTMLTGSEQR
jgi:ABC-type dipeptide/oligopeptide/nickel transport system ATPase component/ABC-type dipeptide/oligopeptide/nickel transport system permease subunit